MLVGYARCSTDTQEAGLEAQIRDLTAARCEVIYNEFASAVGERSEFTEAINQLKPGDTLVVTKIDRFARSNIGFWKTVEEINAKGAYLRVLNLGGETIDTKSATGRLILTVFAGFAQFEREIMLERMKEGVAKAKAEGKYKGRKPMSDEKRAAILEMNARKISKTEIARQVGLCRETVGIVCAAAERN